MLCSIVPPHILQSLAERGDDEDRVRALVALELSLAPRTERAALVQIAGPAARRKRRWVFDAAHGQQLPGLVARSEGTPRVRDVAVNEAYDGAGRVYDFFRRNYGRFSVDDRAARLDSTVHFGERFNNAHWDGRQMIYGDGDGKYFRRFTSALDVIAHELTHGITQHSAAFAMTGQAGALAEHFSDVFGILAKQYWSRTAEWIIGADLFTGRVNGDGIRSMKSPGSAYDDPILGRDPQPSHIRDYVHASGPHINSGIPNHAFYRAAALLGGRAWETAGKIWYRALTRELGPRSHFQHCADATWRAAGELFGAGSEPQDAVKTAWQAVGIRVAAMEEVFVPPIAAAEVPVLV